MIKKVYWIYCLILIALSARFLLGMEMKLDLTDPEYLQIKEQLRDDVKKGDIDGIKNWLQELNKYVWKRLGAKDTDGQLKARPMVKEYQKDLIQKPQYDSAIDIALEYNHFELLHMLLKLVDIDYITSLDDSGYFTPGKLPKYRKLKEALVVPVENNDIEHTKEGLSELSAYLLKPFKHIDFSEPENIMIRKYYFSICAKYLGNLLLEPMQIATKNKNFTIIYLLLRKLIPKIIL